MLEMREGVFGMSDCRIGVLEVLEGVFGISGCRMGILI
jgi:hypothetical protein